MKRIALLIVMFLGVVVLQATYSWAGQAQHIRDYLLSPGDILEVSVWNDEALQRESMIRPDGMISFPLIGDVPAAGKTVRDLRKDLEDRINEYVPGTPVTVILNYINHPRMYVVGKVDTPGHYIMEKETTVVQALAMAGGLTTFASKNNILVLRQNAQEQEVFSFRYGDIENGRNLEQNIVLMPGDTIVVP